MSENGNNIIGSPEDYTPEFCDAVRLSLAHELRSTRDDIKQINRNMFNIAVLIFVQLFSVVGSLAYFILSKVTMQTSIDAITKTLGAASGVGQ